MIGKTISHYQVLEKLGQGGMGEVFLALDTSLDRKVALKFLPESMQQHPVARKRLLREARSAAALDHPYICHIHEIGEVEGRDFIAMEYVEGQTLKARLAQDTPIPLEEVLKIAAEIAEALEKAHQRGIVHRDLKPSNIMQTPEGHIKLMDFGLAKPVVWTEPAKSADKTLTVLTKEGTTPGTLAYMSPEQLRGEQVDTRSDIFSFGVVLYEMLTGVHPFHKATIMNTANSILNETPHPLSRFTEGIPKLLEHTVRKTLAKNRNHRYQSVHELNTNLSGLLKRDFVSEAEPQVLTPRPLARNWVTMVGSVLLTACILFFGFLLWPESGETVDSVVILPFHNESNDPEMDYLCDGLAERITNNLSQVPGLTVIAQSSARRFGGQDEDLQQIARKLNVRAVMTGRLSQRGETLFVSTELVDSEDNSQLWGNRLEQKVGNILALEANLAQEIAEALRLKLTGTAQQRLSKQYTESARAHELYLKGLYHFFKQTEQGVNKAFQYFNQALEEDPNYALAHAGLAGGYSLLGLFDYLPPEEAFQEARAAAERALTIDDTLAEAHAALGMVRLYSEFDWKGAESAYQRALLLNPGLSGAHLVYGDYLMFAGRPDEAVAEFKRALELDPVSALAHSFLADGFFYRREYDLAIAQCQEALELEPNFIPAKEILHDAYWETGRYEEAIQVVAHWPDSAKTLLRHMAAGRKKEAMEILEQQEEEWAKGENRAAQAHVYGYQYVRLGENEKALRWLERVYEERDGAKILIALRVHPIWDPLRSLPRFEALLTKVGIEP
ncbi:protein kinase [Acidobacteria bacterium AH-259-G07]|nr:protein kinase [Acidobacteria bacterium AH-259-G07]